MAEQKLTDRQSLSTSSDSSLIHVVEGGSSYKQTKDNFLKEDRERLDALEVSDASQGTDIDSLESRVDNLEENQYSGVVVYETLASLPATGTVNTSYKVSNDSTSSNNGYYHWSGSAYVKDYGLAEGVIESGNVDAISGNTVFTYGNKITKNIFHTVGDKFYPEMFLNTQLYYKFPITATNYRACIFDVLADADYTINGVFNTNVVSIQILDNFYKVIGTPIALTTGTGTYDLTTPTNARFVIVNLYNSNCEVICNTSGTLELIKDDTFADNFNIGADFSNYLKCRNGLDINIELNKYFNSAGVLSSDGGSRNSYTTDYIFLASGYTYNFKYYSNFTSTYYVIYDSQKTIISTVDSVAGWNTGTIVGDDNYVRFSVKQNYGLSLWLDEEIPIIYLSDSFKITTNDLEEITKSGDEYIKYTNILSVKNASVLGDENMIAPMNIGWSNGADSLTPNPLSMTTDYIPINLGDYSLSYNSVGSFGIAFYDKYKRYVTGFDFSNNTPIGWTTKGGDFSVTDDSIYFIKISGYNDVPFNLYTKLTTSQKRSKYDLCVFNGKKLVTLGDSITASKNWQSYLCEMTGVIWDKTENDLGSGTHWELADGTRLDAFESGAIEIANSPTAIAGTGVRNVYITDQDLTTPTWVSGLKRTSISSRARDVKYYNPDIIFIWGGANDFSWVDNAAIWGTIDDTPYLGEDVDIITYSDTTPPNHYQSYMGMLQQLSIDNPEAKIFCLSLLPWRLVDEATATTYDVIEKKVNTMIRECAEKYNIPYIDLYSNLGWNHFNNTTNYDTPIGDREVHPNNNGQIKIAKYLSQFIK